MTNSFLLMSLAAASLLSTACTDSGTSQELATSTPSTAAESDPGAWQHPRTEWGDPDLRGMWPVVHLIGVPFQRPEQYGDRRFMSDEELAEARQRVAARNERYDEEIKNNKMGMGHWAEETEVLSLTSLIVDPPNGRFPELTDLGKERAKLFSSSWSTNVYEKPTDFNTWDRCITRGLPSSMMPFQYNNGIEIHQAPGYVVIRLEMIHEARVVPIDGRPALDSAIKQWMGESRGRWEDNTLVVETTNFNGLVSQTNFGIPGSPRNDQPSTTNLRLVERFTRTDADTMEYSMSVEDPDVLTQPWTVAYPMKRDEGYEFFEYACHEDNTAVRNFIETSRYERAQASKAGQ